MDINMKKCIYRCGDNLCGRSTSDNHCKIVNDDICKLCDGYQRKLLQQTDVLSSDTEEVIKNAIFEIKQGRPDRAIIILEQALK
jgi:hypothetical protein